LVSYIFGKGLLVPAIGTALLVPLIGSAFRFKPHH